MSAKRSPGPIFAAQPPVVAHAVRRNFRRNNAMPRRIVLPRGLPTRGPGGLHGNAGPDSLDGGPGFDDCHGEPGNDTIGACEP